MPIRFDAVSDRLERSSGVIDYNAAYTWMGWIYITTDSNAITGFLLIDDATANNRDWLSTTNTGTLLRNHVTVGGAATNANGTDLATATWHHVAMVRESATSLKLYLNGVLDTTNTADVSARAASSHMEVASRNAGASNNLNGRVAYMKAWSGSLALAEVQQEMCFIRPRRTTNLYGFWPALPGATERARDYSGGGRDWTEGGTLTDEDPPPVGWAAVNTPMIYIPAAPAASVRAYASVSYTLVSNDTLSLSLVNPAQSDTSLTTNAIATEE